MDQKAEKTTIQSGDVETQSLLLHDEESNLHPPFLCHLWWRNPLFYLASLFGVEIILSHFLLFFTPLSHFLFFSVDFIQLYSTISLIIHFSWLFVWGIVISTISTIVFGVGVIYYSTFSTSYTHILSFCFSFHY